MVIGGDSSVSWGGCRGGGAGGLGGGVTDVPGVPQSLTTGAADQLAANRWPIHHTGEAGSAVGGGGVGGGHRKGREGAHRL